MPLSGPTGTKYWNSPSGLFNIVLEQKPGITYMTALPAGEYSEYGYGVTGCFNQISGNIKVLLLKEKGRNFPEQNC